MRVAVHMDDRLHDAIVPFAGADHVLVDFPCPTCGGPTPTKVGGRGIDAYGHDFEESPAATLCCGANVGRLRVTYSTIFGIEEDRAVMNGRARVY